MAGRSTEVVGCDVARGTWVAVVLQDGSFDRAMVAATLAEVASAFPSAEIIAVDIPIGLPTFLPRAADQQARDFVGPRRSSVFFTPVRAAVEEADYSDAVTASVAATGKGISRQAHALSRMILDGEPAAAADQRIYEGHPEVTFREMAGEPLVEPKASWNGMQRRLGLLAGEGIHLPRHAGDAGKVRPDDLLDGAALAWTAARIAAGAARRLGDASTSVRDQAIYV